MRDDSSQWLPLSYPRQTKSKRESTIVRPSKGAQGAKSAALSGAFFVGPENRLLKYFFDSLETESDFENPILFTGPPSSGKTSLALTLADRWQQLNSNPPPSAIGIFSAAD
ncbi:MAG: ATP-binding protein, partial [Pirellulaceae bacterium]|nr:ATP-binding protein [Pirellulaceae bacterium]